MRKNLYPLLGFVIIVTVGGAIGQAIIAIPAAAIRTVTTHHPSLIIALAIGMPALLVVAFVRAFSLRDRPWDPAALPYLSYAWKQRLQFLKMSAHETRIIIGPLLGVADILISLVFLRVFLSIPDDAIITFATRHPNYVSILAIMAGALLERGFCAGDLLSG